MRIFFARIDSVKGGILLIFISIPENVDFGESKSYCLPIHRRGFSKGV